MNISRRLAPKQLAVVGASAKIRRQIGAGRVVSAYLVALKDGARALETSSNRTQNKDACRSGG